MLSHCLFLKFTKPAPGTELAYIPDQSNHITIAINYSSTGLDRSLKQPSCCHELKQADIAHAKSKGIYLYCSMMVER